MKKYKARIYWLSKKEGGRTTIPFGDKYAPIIKLPGVSIFSDATWSIFVENTKNIGENETEATVHYLSSFAPDNLRKNSKFELYEGVKMVAKGIIIQEIRIN